MLSDIGRAQGYYVEMESRNSVKDNSYSRARTML